ncbi:hypothetical protein EJB05_54731, partial [Eragrostis curvula]
MMMTSNLLARANTILDLNDDVVGLILELCIDSQVSLIRAASTCKRWRRVIADAAFLRRFRSLHAATVAGDYYNDTPMPLKGVGLVAARKSKGPVFVPSPSLPIDGRHHSLDFLPHGGGKAWAVVDSRGGLLLMTRRRRRVDPNKKDVMMVVCEPLTRRYSEIPPPPAILFSNGFDHYIKGYYLVDGDADEAGGRIGMSNFRVFFELCHALGDGVPHTAAVFAAAGDGSSWSEKAMDQIMAPRHGCAEKTAFVSPHYCRARVLGTVAGSRYTYLEGGTLVALDCSTGEFSSSQLPANSKYSWDLTSWPFSFHAVEGYDGEPRIFTLFFDEMRVFARSDDDGDDWRLETSLRLGEATRGLPGYDPSFFTGVKGFKLLTRGPGFVILNTPVNPARWSTFSVNLETMEVAPAADDLGKIVYQCELPWPPTL